jgi:hypothetical protein
LISDHQESILSTVLGGRKGLGRHGGIFRAALILKGIFHSPERERERERERETTRRQGSTDRQGLASRAGMEIIVAGMHDADPQRRRRALEKAGSIGKRICHAPASRRQPGRMEEETERMRSVVSSIIMRDVDPGVRQYAMDTLVSLSHVGDVSCVQLAIKMLDDAHSPMRERAVEALSMVARPGDAQVIGALISRLDEGGRQRNMMRDACSARETNSVRVAMVRTLGVLTDGGWEARIVAQLAEIGECDADPDVREAARNVLLSLGKENLFRDLQYDLHPSTHSSIHTSIPV